MLISHDNKGVLKILQVRLQQYMNPGLPDIQAGFRKGRGTRDQIASILWIIEKASEFQINNYFRDYNKLENSERNGTTRPPYLDSGQEATVRTGHGTMDCFKTGKGVRKGCILSPCSFNICREHQGKFQAG